MGLTSDAAGPSTRSAARDTATVAGWTLVSRVTGLLRVVVAGAVMGPTFFGNTFQIAYVLPGLIYSTVAGPVLGLVLVPAIVAATERGGPAHARRVSAGVAFRVLGLATAAATVLLALSPVIAGLVTVGYPQSVDTVEARRLALLLFLFVAPQIVLYTVAALGIAAQQAHGRFAVSAGAPAVENLGLITTVLVAGVVWGPGLEIGQVPDSMIVWLGLGSTLSVALHAALQYAGAVRCGSPVRPSWRAARSPEAADPVNRLIRSAGVAAWPSLSMFVVLTCAGTVAGGVIIAQMGYAVYNAAAYLTGRAVAVAALPRFARAARSDDAGALAVCWRQCTGYALLAGVPALVALGTLAPPVADVLARGRLAEPGVVRVLAAVLVVVAVAQLIGGLHDLGRQALFAARIETRARRGSEIATLATFATSALALLVPEDGPRLVVLVLAIPIGELAGALVVAVGVRQVIGSTRLVDGVSARAVLLGALVMLPALALGLWWYSATVPGPAGTVGIVAAAGAVALVGYAVVVRRRLPHPERVP